MPSYEKRNGLWSVRYRENTPEGMLHYKRLSGKFKTKKEAIAAYEDFIANKALEPTKSDMLFSKLVEVFLEHEKARTKQSSVVIYTGRINKHILPVFGACFVREITPAEIQQWQHSNTTYSFQYQKALNNVLKHIFKYGEKTYGLPNVMETLDSPRNLEGKKEMMIWTPEQFEKFIVCVSNPTYKLFFQFLYLTGCRRGEALAISWEDIDLDNNLVSINKSYAGRESLGGISTPKNSSSYRQISIPKSLSDDLRAYHKTHEGRFVFGDTKPLEPATIRLQLNTIAKRAGVPIIRIHDLRHSHASLLLSSGVPVTAVSRRLGHSNVVQTYNRYSHVLPNDQSAINSVLDGLNGFKMGSNGKK